MDRDAVPDSAIAVHIAMHDDVRAFETVVHVACRGRVILHHLAAPARHGLAHSHIMSIADLPVAPAPAVISRRRGGVGHPTGGRGITSGSRTVTGSAGPPRAARVA
jgi:hypothetical protein